uniref:Ubiquitin-fold modifier-conjugating enzyme 1 n=1 Tax=Schistocephalus solidus TaxID=70667 RepID=A0A0X3NWK5_SCHSO
MWSTINRTTATGSNWNQTAVALSGSGNAGSVFDIPYSFRYIHEMKKYEFDVCFDIPVSYPATSPEIMIPDLDGKTAKMYRGGKICLTDHFKPLWTRNVPKFGIAHAMALGLGPWLAVEIPDLISKGIIKHRDDE